ncbi:MAG: hypothetical protein WBC51_03540 [Vicinamibacterales bacterium]
MWKGFPRLPEIAVCAAMAACGGSDATPTNPSPARYDGQWRGTTSQGRPISFTVSSDQKVTAMSIGYVFGQCSGVNSFSNLNLDIGLPPTFPGVPRAPTPYPGPGFGYGSGSPEAPNYTQVYGWFTSSTTASGSMIFGNYTGCGNSFGIWTAEKQ